MPLGCAEWEAGRFGGGLEGARVSSIHRGWGHRLGRRSGLPPPPPVSPGGVLRDVAGRVGYGWRFVWFLAPLSNLTHCWRPPLGLSLHTVGWMLDRMALPFEAVAKLVL